MKKEDLDKTIPIDILKEENLTRSSKYDEDKLKTRSEKYESLEDELQEDVPAVDNDLEDTIEVKKIEDLDDMESKDSENDGEEQEKTETKKENVFVKLKKKFMALPTKAKIFVAILCGIVVSLLIVLIFMLIAGGKDKEDEKLKPTEEEPVIIVDNYYYKDGLLYFLNEEEKEIGTYECDNKNENKCYVAFNTSDNTLDISKKLDHDGESIKERTSIINEDYVFVYDSTDTENVNINLYSISKEESVDTYNSVNLYADNYAIVSKNGDYGLIQINEEVKESIKPIYDDLYFVEGMTNVVGRNKNGYIVLDKNGAELSKSIRSDVDFKYYNDNYVVVKDEDGYVIYNYQGEELVSGYEFATVYDEYMLLVKDDELYIRDVNNTKYNESGYKLKNNNYIKTTHYDKDGKFLKKDISFEILKDDDNVQLLIYSGEEPYYHDINIVEALANTRYSYMSYFDGKLYFYSDDLKENLLGYYTCTNKNELLSSEDTLSNCMVASDTLYEKNDMEELSMINRKAMIPIIHNRFVFIKDGKVTYLYDLVNKVSKEYTSASSYTVGNDNKLTFKDSDTYVIVLNKKGKYALLKVGKESFEVVISFKYSAMERVGDYIVAQVSESSYDVYKLGDDTALFNIKGKMVGYSSDKKYIKYMEGSSYVVADFQGTKISNTKYSYVELYNGYYAAVTNKKLNIYDYEGNKITKEELDLNSSNYSRVEKPAFKVTKSGSDYVVSILTGNNYIQYTYYTSRDTYKELEAVPGEPVVPEDSNEESGS